MKEVKISIIGHAGSGKSRLMYVIKEALKSHGVSIDELKFQDHDREYEFDKWMSQNLDESLSRISEKTHITIEEIQANRRFPKENS